MAFTIGLLLPRSSEYPSIGFDMLDGLRGSLARMGINDSRIITENIGFGEDLKVNYAMAEKMLLQENAQVMIVYSNFSNAEALFPLAETSGRPFIFLDAGMQVVNASPQPNCYHISLQGLHACVAAGERAGSGNRKVLMATSFYDGGYRGPWGYHTSVEAAGGSICGNYVSTYKTQEFSIDNYLQLLQHSGAERVAACFSCYLAELFMAALKKAGAGATALPFYCSPFMAEEQLLAKCDFPGGSFHAVVPWTSLLSNEAQQTFTETIQKEKNKAATLFHLLGWEAGILTNQLAQKGAQSLSGFMYQSPRGNVTVHPETHHTVAPLYYGEIVEGENGKCRFDYKETILLSEDTHIRYLKYEQTAIASGWRNNYFCI